MRRWMDTQPTDRKAYSLIAFGGVAALGAAIAFTGVDEGHMPPPEAPTTTTVAELIPPISLTIPPDNNEDRSDRGLTPGTYVEIFEDGSGIQWVDGVAVQRFDEGTFQWDCRSMGNRVCGR